MKASKKLFAVLAVLALAITVMPVISTPVAAAGAVITSATGKWVEINGSYYFEVDYTAANVDPSVYYAALYESSYTDSLVNVPAASSGSLLVPESDILNYYTVGVDSYLILDIAGATTAIPITMYNVTSNFGSSYVSGEPVGAVTGTVTAFNKTSTIVTSTVSTPTLGLALVAVWEDKDGNTHSASVPNGVLTATVLSDGKTATFAVKAGDIRFTVPAGSVYLVSKNIADNMGTNGKVYGVSVAKYAYKTIEIKQAKFTVNPKTITLPPFDKEVYVYDEFGYPVKNTDLKVQLGYKVTATQDAGTITARTDANGKLTLEDIPQPLNYGTYTATLSTVVGGNAVVDGVGVLHVSYGTRLVLSESIIHTSTIHQLGTIKINVESSGSPIKKLQINVDDPNDVLENFPSGAELLVERPFEFQQDKIKEGPCNIEKTVKEYWFAKDGQSTATLYGTAVQGGTITVTATAELADGSLAVATKEYVVKAYRIDSISPNSIEYGTSGMVTVRVKDWYGGYVDDLSVVLYSSNDYGQVGPQRFTLIPQDFGTYSFTIPAGAVPGKYAVLIDGVDYSKYVNMYFKVAPVKDLKIALPGVVNAMSKFDVTVTDKDGTPVSGTWVILTQIGDSIVNGKFSVDTSAFKDGSKLGEYTLTVLSSDGKHAGTATFAIVAPSTITPTMVTHGFKSSVVATMTSTALNASLIELTSRVYSSADKVTIDKDYSAQTATLIVKVLKSDMCSKEPTLTLKYGKFVLDNGALKIGHPQLSFVKTATWYAKDIVPMQVKLVDALGNPIKGAVVKVSQLGYFELTATTNAEGIADFGNVTLNAAGNVVAELVFNPELEKVVDYRLFGQTDNINYKVVAQVEPARPAQALKVTVTPTIVDAGKDALLTLTLVGADEKPVETGKSVVVTIGPSTYNGLVGANGVVTLTVKAESLTGTVVTGVVKVEGYNAATFTLAVTEKPVSKTVIELAPGMDVYTVNGETKFWDATPYIKEGRTMVPIRHLAEALGFKASWDFSDPANKMVFIFKADQDPEKDKEHPFILLIIGQPTAMVSGNLVALDVAPEILNGRTMVPLRFVVETLGYKVEWLGNTVRLYK